MKRLFKSFLVAIVFTLALATTAHAQATRTWVSGVGDDANPCSRTAPCKTFAGAISKTAAGGEIDALDPAGYGALTITKALTIDGGGNLASVLVAGTNAINVQAGATDTVTLRNLGFNGTGSGLDGVSVTSAGTVIVEHCTFEGFTQSNIEINSTTSTYALVEDSTMTGGHQGVVIDNSSGPGPVTALLKNVTIQGTQTALRTLRGHIDVTDSIFQNNAAYGAYAQVGSINLMNSVFSFNGIALDAGPAATIAISNVNLLNNTVGIAPDGGIVSSAVNNRSVGNATPGMPTATTLIQ